MGGWVLGPLLGRGSTAVVHLAASTSGEQESFFAVKSAELSRSAPLQREHKILSSLCSPHVVSCLGSDVTAEPDGRVLYHLFMEYVPGGSLAEAVKERGGGLDEGTTRVYARGILQGLAYLHSRGVVHGDVKGQNVLVREEGVGVKLADLGCARWVDGERGGGGAIGGTPLYMAPEVARGEEQGPAADIWALGCTVIEMATGFPPWRDVEDPVAAIHRIAFSADVPDLPCNISDDANDFLGRCLNRDPRKRWSAEELLSHPFVRCDEESTTKRNSPKSILDQDFWHSWPEEEEEEEEDLEGAQAAPDMDNQPLLESAQGRLRRLAGGRASPAPATWEECCCWIMVRHDVTSSNSAGGSERCWVSPESWAGERLQFEIPTGEDEPSTRHWVPAGSPDCCDCAAGFAATNPCSHSSVVSCNAAACVREGDDTFVHNHNSPYPSLPIKIA